MLWGQIELPSVTPYLVGVCRNARNAFQPEVKGSQRVTGLVHEDDEEPSQTGVHVQRDVVTHSQLQQPEETKAEVSLQIKKTPTTTVLTLEMSSTGSMIPCGNCGAEQTSMAVFLPMARFMA